MLVYLWADFKVLRFKVYTYFWHVKVYLWADFKVLRFKVYTYLWDVKVYLWADFEVLDFKDVLRFLRCTCVGTDVVSTGSD